MMGRRIAGGIVAITGYLLSPLSWWNDIFINVPLAYLFASAVEFLFSGLFFAAFVAGYWLTNIAGLVMLHLGGREALAPHRRESVWQTVRSSLFISLLYTLLIVALVQAGYLSSIQQLLRHHGSYRHGKVFSHCTKERYGIESIELRVC